MASSTSVAVVGATGFGGAELTKYLHDHPHFSPDYLTSQSFVGESFSSVYPRYQDRIDVTCQELDPDRLDDYPLVFFALPHGESMKVIPRIDRSDTLVVDLAADYRFPQASQYETVYGSEHQDPDGCEEAVYGLTEVFEESIASGTLVACPGCYATSMLIPLQAMKSVDGFDGSIYVDSKSGISGAGRRPKSSNTYVQCNEDVRPYDIAEHRHESEVEQYFGLEDVTFVPHVVPADRGIESALYCTFDSESSARKAAESIRSFCGDHELLRYREEPTGMKATANTPFCDVSAQVQGRSLLVFSYLDNLDKGAATQAIQNANLMNGYPVETGLLTDH